MWEWMNIALRRMNTDVWIKTDVCIKTDAWIKTDVCINTDVWIKTDV